WPHVSFSHALKFTNLINPYALNALLLTPLAQADDLCVREILVSPCQYLQRTRFSDALLLALKHNDVVELATGTSHSAHPGYEHLSTDCPIERSIFSAAIVDEPFIKPSLTIPLQLTEVVQDWIKDTIKTQ